MLGRAQIRNAPSKSAAAKSVAAKRPSAGQNPWQSVWRQAGWGLAAAAALSVAVLSGRDDDVPQKVAAMLSSLRSQQPAAHSFDAETAARQLAQSVRGLADDRDKLATRLNAIEREMRDMRGAIKQQIEAAKTEAIKTAKQAPPWPESAPPVPLTLADVAVMVKTAPPAPATAAEPPSSTAATSSNNTDEHAPPDTTASLGQAYGVDLGAASTMKTLNHRWCHCAPPIRNCSKAFGPWSASNKIRTPAARNCISSSGLMRTPRRRRNSAILSFRFTSTASPQCSTAAGWPCSKAALWTVIQIS